jgi:multimeric flavodoxin WrbA
MRASDMRILVIDEAYRPKGATTGLTEAALGGAVSVGVETEMVLLRDHDVK